MLPILHLKERGGVLFLLLCLICVMSHSGGMLTLFCIFCFCFLSKIRTLDSTAKTLLTFSVLYIFISIINGAITTFAGVLTYGLPWVIFYCYGKFIYNNAQSQKSIISLILLLAFLSAFTIFVTIITKIITTGQLVDVTRQFYFLGDESQETTGNGICLDIFIGFSGLANYFCIKEYPQQKKWFLFLFVLSILVPINVVTRTPIVVSVVCLMLCLMLKKKDKRTFGAILIIIVAYCIIINSSDSSIKEILDAYADRNEGENIATASDRSYRWTDALMRMFVTPFGWYNDKSSYVWVHNMWLDIAKYSGIIPFVLLVIPSVKSIINGLKLVKTTGTPLSFVLFNINICFILSCFGQPLYGSLTAGLGCMIWGIQQAYLDQINRMK